MKPPSQRKARRKIDLAEAPPHRLSHGQKQRVAFAGALATHPPLLLDEPSAGLDPPGKRTLAVLLQGSGAAMLVAVHNIDFAKQFCTRFLRLERRQIVFDGADF